MSNKTKEDTVRRSFSDEELSKAARLVSEAMLNALPEPDECRHEFSEEFRTKMDKLFRRDKAMRVWGTVRKWAAAIIVLILVSGGVVLTVDAEARASFFAWVKEIYENSIIYEFYNEPQEEGLPSYELGWLPEGYEVADVYQSETLYSAIYMKGDDADSAFVFEYSLGNDSTLVELLADESKYECKNVTVNGATADFYRSLDSTETNNLIWISEKNGIVFVINGYLDETVMLHIAEGTKLCNVPK